MLPRVRRSPWILLLGLAACGPAVPAEAPRLVTPPRRIVAGSVLAAEVLLEIAPHERIAAVHYVAQDERYSMVAAAAAELPSVGAEPEDLLSVDPDLVIVDAYTRPETLALLASARVPVLRVGEASSFADIANNIRTIGRVCHLESAAEALVTDMNAQLERLADRGVGLPEWQVMSLDGGMRTLGAGSLFDAVVRAAGARNLAAAQGAGPFRVTNIEYVLVWQPQALVVMTRTEAEERKWIAEVEGLELVPAVAEDHILFVPGAAFGTTSHHLVATAVALQDALLRWGQP